MRVRDGRIPFLERHLVVWGARSASSAPKPSQDVVAW